MSSESASNSTSNSSSSNDVNQTSSLMIETENVFAQLKIETTKKAVVKTISTSSPLHIEDYYRFGTSVKNHISYIKELMNKSEKTQFETKVLVALNVVLISMKRFMMKSTIRNEVFIVFQLSDLLELFFTNCNFDRNITMETIEYWESMEMRQKILFNTLISIFNYLIRLKVDNRIDSKVDNYEYILVVMQFSFAIHSDKFPTNEEFYYVAVACAECVNRKKAFTYQNVNNELEKISSTIRFSAPSNESPLKRYESLSYLNTEYTKKKNSKNNNN